MKRALLLSPLLLVALAACTEEEPASAPLVEAPTTLSSAPAPTLPPDPQPTADGPCPYLENSFVEQANAQRVGKVQVSADQPPTCFFYRRNGDLQVTVRVYSGDATVAKALVDAAAPVATSNPAELTGGWQGGAESKDAGAVYAVAKDGSAVIVTIDHKQTIKARQIAQESITGLGL
jgi:hypothetical protein